MSDDKRLKVGTVVENVKDCTHLDMMESLLYELKQVDRAGAEDLDMRIVWENAETEYFDVFIEEIQDALNEYAPPYCYFGWDEMGENLGCYPDSRAIMEGVYWGEVATVNDEGKTSAAINGKRVPMQDYAVYVNDHGNTTFYRVKIELEEVWSAV